MQYCFAQGQPIREHDALAIAAELGFHALAYDYTPEDESLHWHEFDSVSWVISGTGAFADADGNVTEVQPGCRLDAPAGWLHRDLAGPTRRIVRCTNIPGNEWTTPINKDPAERPQ
ncbi:MAG: hypothetical protein ACXVGQ_03305 [Mycobacteriaceae bacterium]